MNPLGIFSLSSSILILWLGLLVFLKRGNSRARLIFAWFCLTIFGWFFFYGLMQIPGTHQVFFGKLGHSSVLFVPITYVQFVMHFLSLPRLRPIVRAYYMVGIVSLVLLHSTDWLMRGIKVHPWGVYPVGGPVMLVDALLVAIAAVYCWIMFFVRCRQGHRTGSVEEYNRLKYGCVAMTILSFGGLDYIPKLVDTSFFPIGFATTTMFAVIFTYAILKRQLLDLNIAIRRTAVYSILAALITATYLVAVLIMEKWFQGFMGYRSLVATAIVGFAIALGFNPLRDLVQRFVDRWFFSKNPVALAEENERLRQEVTQSDRLKAVATLAAGMAHEIKNPLASIKTFAEHLPQKYDDPVYREKCVKLIGREVDKMNSLVQRLLDFARPAQPKLAPARVSEIICETLDFLQETLLKRQIQVSTRFEGRDDVLVDQAQMKQVFLNILLNSVEAMEQPGRIAISTAQQNGHLDVTVSDTGPGIPKKDLLHVFDPFYTTKASGTGLGLSVVHTIMGEHGGRVSIASEAGKGTRIKLRLPLNGREHGTHAHSDRG